MGKLFLNQALGEPLALVKKMPYLKLQSDRVVCSIDRFPLSWYLWSKALVVDECIVLVAIVSIYCGGRCKSRDGGRCHGMQSNKEVKQEIGNAHSITSIFLVGCWAHKCKVATSCFQVTTKSLAHCVSLFLNIY